MKEAIESDKDVVVLFFTPWCTTCKRLLTPWKQLALDTVAVSHDLIFAKIDVSTNELEGLELRSYPQLRIYPKGAKDKPIDYIGSYEVEDVKKWL